MENKHICALFRRIKCFSLFSPVAIAFNILDVLKRLFLDIKSFIQQNQKEEKDQCTGYCHAANYKMTTHAELTQGLFSKVRKSLYFLLAEYFYNEKYICNKYKACLHHL